MSASANQVGRLDLAARSLDLTDSLLKATTASGLLLKGAWEIGQWLGRERLNQYELLDCMEKAKGLAFANQHGQQFFDKVISGLDTIPRGPLFLQQSGSLGRLMAGDPNLSWMVSTVACIFQHHRDDMTVTAMLTAFIMESHRSYGEERAISRLDAFIYSPEQTRIQAVVRKIVSSIWYNVVNVGCDTIALPPELLAVCPRGHYLEPADFGIVINTINAHCPSKAILRTTHLLRDVILWLLLHYDGTIVFNVGGEIVYRADLGNLQGELEVHVASSCSQTGPCSSAKKETYKVLRDISGKLEEFLSGISFSEFTDLPSRPGIRQKLYAIPQLYPSDSKMWNRGLQILVKCSAQSIMRWLLSVPLLFQQDFSLLGFSAQPGRKATGDEMTVSLILNKVPGIINLEWGSSPASQVVYRDQFRSIPGPKLRQDTDEWNTELRLRALLECFPVLADLVRKVSADCVCDDCFESSYKHINRRLRPGCLTRLAIDDVLMLLAHGIADGFGAVDTSSVGDVYPIITAMTRLLFELVEQRRVYWDTWFMVASCVYLGCPFEIPVGPSHPAFGGTAFAAIQYGNLAAQAPWLDLTKELRVRGCFHLVGSMGRLGVLTRRIDQNVQFRAVEENFAIVETENSEDTTAFCSRHKKAAIPVDHHLVVDEDRSSLESDVILCQMDDKFYRLLLRVKSKNHWRIVDPSDALNAKIRTISFVNCSHKDQISEISPLSGKIYDMNEVLGRWPDSVQTQAKTSTSGEHAQDTGIIHLTQVLDTHLKKNVALALSVCTTIVLNYPELACPTCTFDWARQAKRAPLRDGEGGNPADRYVINLHTKLLESNFLALRQP